VGAIRPLALRGLYGARMCYSFIVPWSPGASVGLRYLAALARSASDLVLGLVIRISTWVPGDYYVDDDGDELQMFRL